MGYQELIERTRKTVDKHRTGPLARFGLLRLPKPLAADEVMRSIQADLLKYGQVVWAAIAQAHVVLYSKGNQDSGANIVFSPSTSFDNCPTALLDIAAAVFALKDRPAESLADVGDQAVALTIRDEQNGVENLLLPRGLAGHDDVYFSSLTVHRAGLPNRVLTQRIVPLLCDPERHQATMILPMSLWPRELLVAWVQDKFEIDKNAAPKPPDESVASYPSSDRYDEVVAHQRQIFEPPTDGIRVFPEAAELLKNMLAEMKCPPRLAIVLDDGGLNLEPVENFDSETHDVWVYHDIEFVVPKGSRESFYGTVIDAKQKEAGPSLALYDPPS